MLLMAFETATETAGVAIADDQGLLASATFRGRRHAESLMPAAQFLLGACGRTVRDLDAVAVDVGPGLFTGLRVGVASAKAIAYALGLRALGLTSLEVLASAVAGASPHAGGLIVPVVDARRGEVFSARYLSDPLRRVAAAQLWQPAALAHSLSRERESLVLVGDGALRYRDLFEKVDGVRLASADLASPPVGVLASLAVSRLAEGEGGGAETLAPLYLREADVRINWEERLPPRREGRIAG